MSSRIWQISTFLETPGFLDPTLACICEPVLSNSCLASFGGAKFIPACQIGSWYLLHLTWWNLKVKNTCDASWGHDVSGGHDASWGHDAYDATIKMVNVCSKTVLRYLTEHCSLLSVCIVTAMWNDLDAVFTCQLYSHGRTFKIINKGFYSFIYDALRFLRDFDRNM